MHSFEVASELPVKASDVLAWLSGPKAFERLLPPWWDTKVVKRDGGPCTGGALGVRFGSEGRSAPLFFSFRDHVPGRGFLTVLDRKDGGNWEQEVSCLSLDSERCRVVDRFSWSSREKHAGAVGSLLFEETSLKCWAAYRHHRIRLDIEKIALLDLHRPLRIAVSGASGLIGSELCLMLECAGHEVLKLVRSAAEDSTGVIRWNPVSGNIDRDGLEGLDAVVHLAGENISTGRWTRAKKEAILESRSRGTALLADAISGLKLPPKVLLSASAVHYYGVGGQRSVDESTGTGNGFLASVCREWEKAARGCEKAGVRLVHPRIGVVVSGRGGFLKRLLLPFSLGLGGPVGHGRQMLSWISLDDLVKCFCDLIGNESYRGPVNAVSPDAVSNKQFARTLGRVLGRPAVLPLPGAFVKLAFGEMGSELLLNGVRVVPGVLQSKNFRFRFADLEQALRFELGKAPGGR